MVEIYKSAVHLPRMESKRVAMKGRPGRKAGGLQLTTNLFSLCNPLPASLPYQPKCYDSVMTLRTAITLAGGVALAVVSAITGFGQSNGPELKAGDMAPAFNLPGSDGRNHSLADHKGKSAVVLAWFPKAFTGG